MCDGGGRHVSNFDGGSPIIPLRDGTEKKVEGRGEDGEGGNETRLI